MHKEAGEETTLILENHDLYGHSFDSDELNLHAKMDANGSSVITFTATDPGTYEVYCGVPGHREAGMVSTLVVEPDPTTLTSSVNNDTHENLRQ